MPPGMALIVTLRGSKYCSLEHIFMVPKGFEPSKFDCTILCRHGIFLCELDIIFLFDNLQNKTSITNISLREFRIFTFEHETFGGWIFLFFPQVQMCFFSHQYACPGDL